MFDFFGGIISSTITTLFPVFASYKALRTSDPAQLTPWLMYWVVLSLILLVESYIPLIAWFPFYGWLRILPLTYLLLPGENQGATFLYRSYVHPFLAHHEADIEQFISTSHAKAKKAGLQYIQDIIEFVRVRVLGGKPAPPPPAPNRSSSASYAQSLLARFSLPSAREGLAAPAGDFYGLLSAALQQATSGSGSAKSADAQARDLSASGTLIPPNIRDAGERLSYVSAQRNRLRVLLQAFDKEAAGLEASGAAASHASGEMRTSKSELDFDKISQEDVDESAAAWGQWARGKSMEFFGGSKDKSKGE